MKKRLQLIGGPLQKGWKITKKATCLYEREYVPMKDKGKGFWLKRIGGPLRKRLQNHEKRTLCLWTGICVYEGAK